MSVAVSVRPSVRPSVAAVWIDDEIGSLVSQVSPPFAIAHSEPYRTRNDLFPTELTNNGDSYGIVP